jgi:hypothetical protein
MQIPAIKCSCQICSKGRWTWNAKKRELARCGGLEVEQYHEIELDEGNETSIGDGVVGEDQRTE